MTIATVWAVGTLVAYGLAFAADVRDWSRYRDVRARRQTYATGALLIAAFAAAGSLAVNLAASHQEVDGARLFVGLSSGAFLAAGIVMAADVFRRQ